ncbi:GrpB family protein [Paenibacillus eucommiae]|uniref:GrpB-like predicted nucleotidyltransferase (UPF0157 family) n=1 Tax=Paenibacillus eucommiae TaxID=1355755 RepID=A0ABS4IQF5_9BACL|nr:GrpB family protein [Paenibacillus eucommiae]MBP1989808.1 GrpB-like predicted nucleotidyltransferase (UPF0157 family) [Paenibacillus eucommiae]
MEEVLVSDYNPEWVIDFEKEKELLVEQLKDIIVGIEHIGSTAVPGLAAKPTIDIMIGVNNLKDITEIHLERLDSYGYEFIDHPHFPERRFFRKGKWRAGTHHLHIYLHLAENWNTNLLFRDYLINHPDAAKEYGKLKRDLKEKFQHDRVGYTNAKAPFIQTILTRARQQLTEDHG